MLYDLVRHGCGISSLRMLLYKFDLTLPVCAAFGFFERNPAFKNEPICAKAAQTISIGSFLSWLDFRLNNLRNEWLHRCLRVVVWHEGLDDVAESGL